MKQSLHDVTISAQDYEAISEQAHVRLSELGFSEDAQSLVLCVRSPVRGLGYAPANWSEIKGSVFAMTRTRDEICEWLDRAAVRGE